MLKRRKTEIIYETMNPGLYKSISALLNFVNRILQIWLCIVQDQASLILNALRVNGCQFRPWSVRQNEHPHLLWGVKNLGGISVMFCWKSWFWFQIGWFRWTKPKFHIRPNLTNARIFIYLFILRVGYRPNMSTINT